MNVVLDPQTCPTVSVDQAAVALGIGRAAAYAAVRAGEVPAIRLGRRLRVPTAALCKMLGLDAEVTSS